MELAVKIKNFFFKWRVTPLDLPIIIFIGLIFKDNILFLSEILK